MNTLTVNLRDNALDSSVAVFQLAGHLDAQTVRDLEASFDTQVKAGKVRWIVDLEKLDYISSAGLGSFVGVLSELRAQGGDIFFVGLSVKMEKIFKVLGFTRIFRVYASENEASLAFKAV